MTAAQIVERAWGRFDLRWLALLGEHEIRLRIALVCGDAQPEPVLCNRKGQVYDAIVRHRVSVG